MRWDYTGWHRLTYPQLAFTAAAYPASATRLSITGDQRYNGAVIPIKITAQKTNLAAVGAGFRVAPYAGLQFVYASGAFYKWTAVPQQSVIDGFLDVQIPLVGGCNQAYGGKGAFYLTNDVVTTTKSGPADSRVLFQDELDVYLADWHTATVTREADTAVALGVRGTPTFRVADGWRYGIETGASTATTPAVRAFVVDGRDSVATIDPNGGTVTFADPVNGDGTLVLANGTLNLAAENAAGVEIRSGATLALAGATRVGSVSAGTGATIRLASGASLAVDGTADLDGVTVAFVGGEPLRWTTVFACPTGALSGAPKWPMGLRTRIVTAGGVDQHQVRAGGFSLFIR